MRWYFDSSTHSECKHPAIAHHGIDAYWRYKDNRVGSIHIRRIYHFAEPETWRVVFHRYIKQLHDDLDSQNECKTFPEAFECAQAILARENADYENHEWDKKHGCA